MQEIQRRHQFSFVKLIISFKRGLHPFYPPSVEVHLSAGILCPEIGPFEGGPLARHPTYPSLSGTWSGMLISAPKLHITVCGAGTCQKE